MTGHRPFSSLRHKNQEQPRAANSAIALRPNAKGYRHLADGRLWAGFPDDPSLSDADRLLVARWASMFTPHAVTASQGDMLRDWFISQEAVAPLPTSDPETVAPGATGSTGWDKVKAARMKRTMNARVFGNADAGMATERTATGRIVTNADFEALADEAETGYDVEKLLADRLLAKRAKREQPKICPRCGTDRALAERIDRTQAALEMARRSAEELARKNGLLHWQLQNAEADEKLRTAGLQRKVRRQSRAIRSLEAKLLAHGEEPYAEPPVAPGSTG